MTHDPQVNEILLLGMETRFLMRYIETGNKKLLVTAYLIKSVRTLFNIWK